MFFVDRTDAAAKLSAEVLQDLPNVSSFVAVGLARGGVPIAARIATDAGISLNALVVDDMGDGKSFQLIVTPFGEGVLVEMENLQPLRLMYIQNVSTLKIPGANQLLEKAHQRQHLYNGESFEVGEKVLLCDDGIVSGRTALAASLMLRRRFGVKEIVLAVPVIPRDLKSSDIMVDEIIFWRQSTLSSAPATGMFYDSFGDVPDAIVSQLVRDARS
ncbi:hypothetical protein IPJ70_00720 [Candidatus Campbellbacteria bacterium]|nr:MAG: hypothetical protein IPJ70_00720 [Candidatus Campbellbacteria bacterium]